MTTQSAGSASSACFAGIQRHLIAVVCGVAFATVPQFSSAQVTYNDFNTPQANSGQTSTSCSTIAGGPAANGVLFCFNSVLGSDGLSYFQDFYPPFIDPNASTDGDAGSTDYALQVTANAESQASSMWFSIPQDVRDGFTAWYAVKISHVADDPSNYFTADGLAFVIQNAAGTPPLTMDPISNCTETGSGFTVLGGGGGCIGYGGIDNSVALEMDTFWDDPYDPEQASQGWMYDDNHMALQSCGPGKQNSISHLTTPNCLITLGGTSTLVTNLNTSAAPPATASAVTLADGNPHQVVIVYNGPNDTPANTISVYLDPAFIAGTHTPVAGSTPLFTGPYDITQSINLNDGTAYVGFTAANGGDWEQHEVMGFTFTPHGSVSANVCASGQTTPAPCSATLPVTFTIATAATYGTPQVVTQGVTNLDFTLGSGSSCTGAMIVGETCTVNVIFAPLAPGLRMGAVNLLDSSGNVLATKLIYGIGEGPQGLFDTTPQTLSISGLNVVRGLSLDGNRNLYAFETGSGSIDEFPAGTSNKVQLASVPVADNSGATAVDGAGNLYVIQKSSSGDIVWKLAGGSGPAVQVASIPAADDNLEIDGAGNFYFSDYGSANVGAIYEMPAGTTQVTTLIPGGVGRRFIGMAIDAAGNLFAADYYNNILYELPAGANSLVSLVSGGDLSGPDAVAVDPAGDIYVANHGGSSVIRYAAGTYAATLLPEAGESGIALDSAGDMYTITTDSSIAGYTRTQASPMTFANTTVGTTSDSQQDDIFENDGNVGLAITGYSATAPFMLDGPQNTCGTGTLASGASCVVEATFTPTTAGAVDGTGTITDNSLNGPGTAQTIRLSGVGINSTYTVGGSVTGLVGSGLVLQDNLGDNLTIGGNGPFTFATAVATGNPYSVTVLSSPIAQNCGVTEGGGTVASSNITNVLVTCTTIPSYGLSVTEIGSGSGMVTSSPGAISCIETNGSVVGQCSDSYLSGTPVTLTANATGTSTFLGWGGACAASGTSPTCSVSVISVLNATASFVQQSFGNVNVCPSGQSTPAPCSGTLTLTYNLAATTTIGVTQVVTQGINGLDFSLDSGGTCTGTIAEGASCTVNVTFTPLAPGLRTGAVRLFDNGGNLLASTPVYGIGQAPEIAFGPGRQTALVGVDGVHAAREVAMDGAGDLFIAENLNNQVVELPAGGGAQTTVGAGLSGPYGVAVDGAGDVFIADTDHNQVVKVPAGGGPQTTVASGLNFPLGVTVDGAGDLFIADTDNNQVLELPAGGAPQKTVASGLNNPNTVVVDSAGDLFIVDSDSHLVEIPASCGSPTCWASVGTGLSNPRGAAVDAAGDVFIADTYNSRVVEVPAGGGPQTTVGAGFGYPWGVAVDGAGDVFVTDTNDGEIAEINRSQLPSLSFALTNVSSTSTDSPQSVSIQNVGNQTLTGSLDLSLGANFVADGSSTCGSGFSLNPGASCSEGFDFTPQATGYLTGTAAFSDNTLNLSSLVSLQTVNLSGNGGLNGQAVGVAVPNVVGLTQAAATAAITSAGLTLGTVSTATNNVVPQGSVAASNPAAGAQVSVGSAVRLLVSTGQAAPPKPNPLSFENNYFVTGDFASAGIQLRGTGIGGVATGTITIPDSTTSPSATQGVPDGADIIDAFLYWETLENTPSPSGGSGTFDNYPITGQQIGSDLPYTDGAFSGTLRVYRADVNTYFPVGANGVRFASGAFTVSLPDGATALPLTEGASLVVIYRVLSPNFPLKSIVIYDGSAVPAISTTQSMQGFYDTAGAGENTALYDVPGGGWNNSSGSVTLPVHSSQFSAPLNAGDAYAAVILSTPVNNSDNDGILDAWKAGPAAGDFYAGQPGYYDVKAGSWVPLPGAVHGEKDLFVQLDYMCGAVLSDGSCDPSQENLFPSPDASGNDPLAMVTNAFAAINIHLHLEIGNAVPEDTCVDNTSTTPPQLCQFPSVPGATQPGVIGWKNSLEFSKLWPRNLASCAAGGDCSPRFPYGQKDSYHYVLFGHSLAIPAWNSRYGSLTSINVASGVTTIVTTDRGTGINYCPSRITISGVLGNPNLNGVYNTTGCANSSTMTVATPGVPNWSYPNTTLPEPVIGITSGTVTSISGYSDLGGSDSAVTLGLWETAPNQNMSKRANVIAGTLFHEIGHTLGLSHGGLYYDGAAGSYVPTFDVNCKPNYQSVMNYLFQLDGVGPNAAVAFSNQQLDGEPLSGLPASVLSFSSLGFGWSTYRQFRQSRDVLDLGLVHPDRAQPDSQRRHGALRRHAAHRGYGLSRNWNHLAHRAGVVE
jgi:sugar lactone lactonase YvrE